MTYGYAHISGSNNVLVTAGPLSLPYYSRPLVRTVTSNVTGVQDTVPPAGAPSTWNLILPTGRHWTANTYVTQLTFDLAGVQRTLYVNTNSTNFYSQSVGWVATNTIRSGSKCSGMNPYANYTAVWTCIATASLGSIPFTGLEVVCGTNNSLNAFYFEDIFVKCF